MTEGNAGEGGFQGVWNRFLSIFNKGKDEVVRSSKVGKARLDLSSLKREREKVFERLGEEIYKRHRENRISLSGFDSFFTEIEIISLKLSSKERELKGLAGEEGVAAIPAEEVRPERRERPPFRHGRRGPHPPREARQEATPPAGEAKAERPEGERRPRRRHHRPRRRPSGERQEAKQEVKQEG